MRHNKLKKQRASLANQGVMRNVKANASMLAEKAIWPMHKKIPFRHSHSKDEVDNYHWI